MLSTSITVRCKVQAYSRPTSHLQLILSTVSMCKIEKKDNTANVSGISNGEPQPH